MGGFTKVAAFIAAHWIALVKAVLVTAVVVFLLLGLKKAVLTVYLVIFVILLGEIFSRQIIAFLGTLQDVSRAFFDIKEGESVADGTRKVAQTVSRRIAYAFADYWLAALSAALVIAMKAFGYDFLVIFLALWAFDVIVANTFVVIWLRTGKDLTLGEDYRRAVDVIHSKSRIAGYLSFFGVIVKASFWDGPEHIVIFFHKEIKTEARTAFALLVLTAIQAILWATIYSLGYESVAELFAHFNFSSA